MMNQPSDGPLIDFIGNAMLVIGIGTFLVIMLTIIIKLFTWVGVL